MRPVMAVENTRDTCSLQTPERKHFQMDSSENKREK